MYFIEFQCRELRQKLEAAQAKVKLLENGNGLYIVLLICATVLTFHQLCFCVGNQSEDIQFVFALKVIICKSVVFSNLIMFHAIICNYSELINYR